jgi:class 3 adenylate cyclase
VAARLSAPGGVLTPYVPRLVLEWDRDHRDELHRRIPGTLVFADLSGFTAMSERLATLGRLGAEELTQHLDATFTEMRARLRAVGRRQTSAGRVTLRMSVGAHTGSVDFFLVGGSVSGGPLGGGHRDLIVAGPAADTVVAMEGIADPGEIVLSPALASAVPERSRGDQKGAGVLLKRAPSLPVGVEVELAPRDVDAGQFLSLPVRNHLTEVEAEGEHRWLTVAFLHLIGVNRVLSEQGPTAAASALQKSLRCIQVTCTTTVRRSSPSPARRLRTRMTRSGC